MNKSHYYAVIMAGGVGTRLWPISRKNKPKQLHALASEKAMIREAFERLLPAFEAENVIISTVPDFVDDIKKILPEIPKDNYIVEPALMGNAAACGLVTATLHHRHPDATALFIPSDHIIKNGDRFSQILNFAKNTIKQYPEQILTLGIDPTKPDTGLGYIQKGEKIAAEANLEAYKVKRFVEKPDLVTAEKYLKSGDYLWNAGMFVWRCDYMLSLYEKYLPNIYKPLLNIAQAIGKTNEKQVLIEQYKKVENTSIDFGIMEKTDGILVIPSDFGWNDVGSWGSLLEVLSSINGKNVISRGNHISVDDNNCLVIGNKKMIATVGLSDIAVIDTPDAILICNSNESQKVKNLLEEIKKQGKEEYL